MLAVARGTPVSATALADALWDADLPARPTEQVGVLVSRLRRVLGVERIVRTDAGFALVADWLDVDELTARVDQSVEALHDGRSAAARAAAAAALALARGPLLPDDEGAWVAAERQRCAALVARARTRGRRGGAGGRRSARRRAGRRRGARRRSVRRGAVAGVDARPAGDRSAGRRARPRTPGRAVDSPTTSGCPPTPRRAACTPRSWRHPPIRRRPPPPPPGGARVVGRRAELDRLDAYLAGTDTGRVVVVEGDGGIGKTALVEHFARHVGERGGRVLVAHADELGRDLPMQPLLDALASIPPSDATPAPDGLRPGRPSTPGPPRRRSPTRRRSAPPGSRR